MDYQDIIGFALLFQAALHFTAWTFGYAAVVAGRTKVYTVPLPLSIIVAVAAGVGYTLLLAT